MKYMTSKILFLGYVTPWKKRSTTSVYSMMRALAKAFGNSKLMSSMGQGNVMTSSLSWAAPTIYYVIRKAGPLNMHSAISQPNDPVNSPAHYTQGRCGEVIDVIEDAIRDAPDPITGMLLGNTLKYLLRVWHKHPDPSQDLGKAQWYLNRVISHVKAKQTIKFQQDFSDTPPLFDDPLA